MSGVELESGAPFAECRHRRIEHTSIRLTFLHRSAVNRSRSTDGWRPSITEKTSRSSPGSRRASLHRFVSERNNPSMEHPDDRLSIVYRNGEKTSYFSPAAVSETRVRAIGTESDQLPGEEDRWLHRKIAIRPKTRSGRVRRSRLYQGNPTLIGSLPRDARTPWRIPETQGPQSPTSTEDNTGCHEPALA